jgi:hypothetical protein
VFCGWRGILGQLPLQLWGLWLPGRDVLHDTCVEVGEETKKRVNEARRASARFPPETHRRSGSDPEPSGIPTLAVYDNGTILSH